MKKIVERFIIGGTNIRPSMPSDELQRALGTIIQIDMFSQELHVPTDSGTVTAKPGDTILCYDDGTFEVEKGAEDGKINTL